MAVATTGNRAVFFEDCLEEMDDEIVLGLHRSLEIYSDQEFYDAYLIAHREKFGTDFEIPYFMRAQDQMTC